MISPVFPSINTADTAPTGGSGGNTGGFGGGGVIYASVPKPIPVKITIQEMIVKKYFRKLFK